MFDIGFPELLLVSVVALLVVGPDRLPESIRTLTLWLGRFRRSFANIKQEIENEIGADEIRAQIYNESILEDIAKSKETLEDVRSELTGAIAEVDGSVTDLKAETNLKLRSKQSEEPGDDISRNSSG
ncbi:MAG: twin-arginine translocase subunit TatB [Gammaproteobacteria bacterium]|jgi:sec-independent protein translocase protein TatB|nr:twin-arginine translocase subunit TatB [Gammaproteobacteria bacterium]|tara:strand:+ start:238 stop:618 length:381 start_codon:yes stop_codon:yes gene_type:complete